MACKQWNERDGEETELEPDLGFQNPAVLSAKTYTLITFHEMENPAKPGGLDSAFVMQRCLHCLEPACVSACPTTALQRQPDGPVSYDADECIGCRYCMLACPWDVPTADWNTRAPKISKCTHCADRVEQPAPIAFNGQALSADEGKQFADTIAVPACVKACPADALRYGTRDEMLALAHKRIADRPDKYVDHIYGEKELGGTSVLYLSSRAVREARLPDVRREALSGVQQQGARRRAPRRDRRRRAARRLLRLLPEAGRRRWLTPRATTTSSSRLLRHKLLTPFNWVLLAAHGVRRRLVRRALRPGPRRAARTSPTPTRGACGSSSTWCGSRWPRARSRWPGIIYVFQRKDLYAIGRSAVLMGLLSYSFVTVTLLADLGLPWNSYQLALQAPEHSAMFEVSWCVGLYVTILLLEFLPVPFARCGYPRAAAALRRWNGAYVAGAVTLFVYLLSRNLLYALAAAVVFGTLAWVFRARDQKAEPIMLAIAAVTLSTMHQSSLGSLYLLMPNMLAPQWWSPVMPVSFFLSAIAAGTALVILIDMWIAKGWRRPLEMTRLASVGQITFWALLVYLVFRLGDMAIRDQLAGAFTGRFGMAFAAEILIGGVLPLILLAPQGASAACRRALRRVAPHGPRRGLQPHERRPLRDDLPGPDALGRTGELHAVDRRVGRVDRPDRRDDLPLRPGGAAHAGALPRGAGRGALSR